jgi:lipopolysaccharide transport system ATP-binding protein
MREAMMRGLAAPWRRMRRVWGSNGVGDDLDPDELWALKDVSFTVNPGEVLGIIGRNGAGKSTLLKILSRITHPTTGHVELCGQVGSLLEVGTGFHPELTGRENIFLNGAILGMPRKEIKRKLDEMVAFAEVDRFLDMPVKRYSSGMYMRLAFAVASHLEPEILVVDEVLAVGDAAFQKKCLGKMDQVSRAGRTVLFVSHNMTAVKSLCSRAILVDQGRVASEGNVDEVVNNYLAAGTDMSRTGVIPEDAVRMGNSQARMRSVKLQDEDGQEVTQLYFGQAFGVTLVCDVLKDIEDGLFEVSVSTPDGTHVSCSTTLDGSRRMDLGKGRYTIDAWFDNLLLPRRYTIDVGVHQRDGTTADFVQRVLDFVVLAVAESGDDHYPWRRVRGLVRSPGRWNVRCCEPVPGEGVLVG